MQQSGPLPSHLGAVCPFRVHLPLSVCRADRMTSPVPFSLPHALSQPPTLSSAHSTPSFHFQPPPDASSVSPTPPASTFERMRHVQFVASYDVSLGLRYVPPTAPLPLPLPLPLLTSPALSALSLAPSIDHSYSHARTSPPSLHFSLFSSYPGVSVVSHSPAVEVRKTVSEVTGRQRAAERSAVEAERRIRKEASRQRRMEQLRKVRQKRDNADEQRRGQTDEQSSSHPALAEEMPARSQPPLPTPLRRSEQGGDRGVRRGWVDVSEWELARERRGQDERLKEERRLKAMQDQIALLKARMGVGEQPTFAPSLSPATPPASHARLPLTFSSSPYAPLSAGRRPPVSQRRPRLSPARFMSPRRRPHPFLRHSPVRRRRLSLSPNTQRRTADEHLQPQLAGSAGKVSAAETVGRQQHRQPPLRQYHQQERTRDTLTPHNADNANISTRHGSHPVAPSVSQQTSRRLSGILSAAYLQSLVEPEIAKHLTELAITSTRPSAPPSPPLIPQQCAAASSPLLHRYASLIVTDHLDELVADVLDRLVSETVTELNAAEERQRTTVVLEEVDDMVSELERLEDSVTQRWLGGTAIRPVQRTEKAEQQYASRDTVTASSTPGMPPPRSIAQVDRSLADPLSSVEASLSLATVSLLISPPVAFHRRVLPVCADVSPQLADPTGVALAEQWCEEAVDAAVDSVVDELWQCMDSLVEEMTEHEVS